MGVFDLIGLRPERNEMINTDDLRYHTEVGTGYSKDAMLAKAADEIDRLRAELATMRIEWRCIVAGETFTTDDDEVANSWRQDGFDVTKHVLVPEQYGWPEPRMILRCVDCDHETLLTPSNA